MSGWYSLSGYLYLKFLGGGLTTLIRSKKRYYFVLDEINCQLAYYKEYDDLAKKRNPTGSIELKNSAVTLNENKPCIFVLHTIGGRQYELEAESDRSALVWLECLQKRSGSKGDVLSDVVEQTSTLRSTDFGIDDRPSSLPSEADLVSASLDFYPADCDQDFTPVSSPQKQCSFYFGSWPSSIDVGPVCQEDASPVSTPPAPMHKLTSPSTASLHFWVNQWMSQQDIHLKDQSIAAGSDCQRELEGSSGAHSVQEDNYVRMESGRGTPDVLKELEQYKRADHTQKRLIEELTLQLRKLSLHTKGIEKYSHDDSVAKVKYFQQQNKFLNAEVIRLSLALHSEAEEKTELIGAMVHSQKRLDKLKMDYAFLLQSCLRVCIGEKRIDPIELKLLSFDSHKERLVQLLAEARKLDPSLPTWESGYVDSYGFRNVFTDAGLALHYAATQLLNFYRSTNDQEKRQRWKEYLHRSKTGIANTKEARLLAREGIPSRYRSAIWRALVHQKVADLKVKYGKYYFRGLCSLHGSTNDLKVAPMHQKQISLDLMRTMPNNVHFNATSQKGVVQLQAVLQAICAHNPNIGYCQGMNFVSAICLLFLNPEDTFWFLVALTERYFIPNYFDHSLTGAQADQEVLKDILEEKLPELAKHFAKRELELTTVTLNWCLALFYDSLPFETLLRVWDCFLLEGPKVLFRFALALLYMHQKTLLECNDTMSILRALKLCARHTYDADALVEMSFETLRPFPPRQELVRRQTKYMELLKVRLQRKDELKAATLACNNIRDVLNQVELVVSLGNDLLIIYCCHSGQRKLAVVACQNGQMQELQQQYTCAVVAAIAVRNVVFLTLLSGDVVSLSVDAAASTSVLNWSTRLADVVLQATCCSGGRLYAAMANGTLAVFENAFEFSEPGTVQLYYIPIGAAPLSCVCLVAEETQIWCGMGGRIVILNAKTLECLERLAIAGNAVGYVPAVFERLLCLQPTKYGIWMATYSSPLVQLWDQTTLTCKLVFDTSSDHQSLHTQIESRITAMLAFDTCVWVGTEDGYVLVYDVTRRRASPRFNERKSPILPADDSQPTSKPSSPRFDRNEPVPSPVRRRTVAKMDTSHQLDSGISGMSSSFCVSNEKLNQAGASPDESIRSIPNMHQQEEAKRWRSCLGLVPKDTDPIQSIGDRSGASKQRAWKNWTESYKSDTPSSRRSYTSFDTASGLEYDDLFVMYNDSDSNNAPPIAGGLLSGEVSKSQSDWNLSVATDAGENGGWSERGRVGRAGKKSRRQFLRRPTRKELKRKDLDVDEYLTTFQSRRKYGALLGVSSRQSSLKLPQMVTEADTDNESGGFDVSDTASVLSLPASAVVEPPYPFGMQCVMRLKIADLPIRGLLLSKSDDKENVISCAGRLDESEAILIWTKDEHDQRLWVPKPLALTRPVKSPPAIADKRPLTRRSTTPWFRPS